MTDDRYDEPTLSPDTVLARIAPRLRHAVVGLAGLTVAILVGSLLATEPNLPTRTQLAFSGIVAAGLGWAVFAAWALTRRAPLFARDRAVAATMALVFSTVTAVGLTITAGLLGLAIGLVLTVAAGLALALALRRRAELLRRLRG